MDSERSTPGSSPDSTFNTELSDKLLSASQLDDALELAQPLVGTDSRESPEVIDLVTQTITTASNPLELSRLFVQTAGSLSEHDIEPGSMDMPSFARLTRLIKDTAGDEHQTAEIERFCANWKINHEYAQAYERYVAPVAESGPISSIKPQLEPRLEDVPSLQEALSRAGLSPDVAKDIFATWNSYPALSADPSRLGDPSNSSVSPQDVEEATLKQRAMISSQVEALIGYADEYGKDELASIITTFGIHNFSRYRPGQLHQQLMDWNDPSKSFENVIVSAVADWNGTLSRAGSQLMSQKSDSSIYFEAGGPTSLAKDLVAIGDRDRAYGRDPLKDSSVKNVIIYGHSNSDIIQLGVNGEGITVSDYVEVPGNKTGIKTGIKSRLNDYRRHLGNDFRLILKSCSTTGSPSGVRNIAETLSDEHGVKVAGSPLPTTGEIIINPDGEVFFQVNKQPENSKSEAEIIPAVVYDGRKLAA